MSNKKLLLLENTSPQTGFNPFKPFNALFYMYHNMKLSFQCCRDWVPHLSTISVRVRLQWIEWIIIIIIE